jgi:hypothetical protein
MSDRCNELCTEEISRCFNDCDPFDIECIQDCTRLAIQYGKKIGMKEIEVIRCIFGDDDDDSL